MKDFSHVIKLYVKHLEWSDLLIFRRLSSEASLRHLTVLWGGEVGQFNPAARLRLVLCGEVARAQGDKADPDIKITR